MKKLFESIGGHAVKIINFKKKISKLLTNVQQGACENTKICYICKESFEDKYAKEKQYCKVRDQVNTEVMCIVRTIFIIFS